MKLSICMMVKNEEKNLERCLNSLEPLRKAVDSELIIVDTGSTDSTVELAKRYTDRVYFHPWNNNFSAMRNTTISYAKGEWLFIVDADEELLVSEPIIRELQKSETPFKAIGIELVNVISSKGDLGSKLITMRFFKNDGQFYYEGTVHNKPVLHGNAIKVDGLLYHYGYVADDAELMENKFNRTSRLLISELDKNPEDVYYLYQLATSYDMYKDNEKALEYYEKAHLVLKDDLELRKQHFYVYGSYVKTLVLAKRYEEAINISNEGLAIQSDYIDLVYFSALAYSFLNNFVESRTRIIKYLELLDRLPELEVFNNPNVQLYTANAKEEALVNLSTVYIKTNEFEHAISALNLLSEIISIESANYSFYVNNVILTSVETEKYSNILDIYQRSSIEQYVYLDGIVYQAYSQISDKNSTYNLVKTLASLPSDLGQLFRCLSVREFSLINYNLVKVLDIVKVPEIMIFQFENYLLCEKELLNYDELFIMEVIGVLNARYEWFSDKVSAWIISITNSTEDLLIKAFLLRILYKFLFIVNINNEQGYHYFNEYLLSAFTQIEYKYSELFISRTLYGTVQSAEELFILKLYNLKKSISPNVIGDLQELFPEWREFTLKWIDSNIAFNKEDKELEMLIKTLKDNIQILLNSGQKESALELIREYLSLFPNDLDILLLESQMILN